MAYTDIDKPSDYFRTKLYAGNATNNRAITWEETDTNMQADLLWFKSRTDTQTHGIWDSARGALSRLIPSSTGTEGDEANDLDSFDTNGFTVDSAANMNGSSRNFVTWGWKKTATAGFDIVAYTGNGSNRTISHNLGAVPKMMIVKERDNANDWKVYHHSIGNGKSLRLDTTAAQGDDSTAWNSTTPTSSVFSVGTSNAVNRNGGGIIAYLFAEKKGYSKFSSYTGNGNADGTFIYTGFKPAFFMIKRTDSTVGAQWLMLDNKRDTNNLLIKNLFANASDAEIDADRGDFLSNGLKTRSSGTTINGSGASYIYMAFAENPFVTSTGVPATAR